MKRADSWEHISHQPQIHGRLSVSKLNAYQHYEQEESCSATEMKLITFIFLYNTMTHFSFYSKEPKIGDVEAS